MPKHPKSPLARHAEAQALRTQLADVGAPEEVLGPIFAALDHFVTTGQGASGSAKVPGTRVVLRYLLSNQAHITSFIHITRS
jgi:hypothetical protein